MPIDRAATLRQAEKLLRQGKLDQAIAEYLRVVADQPRDWNTANILGDLYVRARQIDKAVEQYIRIADGLSDDGFLPKAGALYKKILKVKPDHERALLKGAEIAVSLGLLADARAYLNTVGERRRSRGDQAGAAQIKIRLGALDPADFEARFSGARARLEIDDAIGAIGEFKEIAAELADLGRPAEAIEALRHAAAISPGDEDIRERLLDIYLGAGDFARARACAITAEQLKSIAAKLDDIGQRDEALATLREAARLDPADAELQAHLARAFVARGDLGSAAEYLTVETAGDNPQLLLTVAEIQLRAGRTDDALSIVRRLLDEDVSRRQDVALLGCTIAERAPEVGFQLVELAADSAVTESDWPSAAAALQEFVTRVPNHVSALVHLVGICVDGGLEATMYSAQAQLADAYIAAGSAEEARFIAEDLVAREPWDRANIERFRRALVILGEPDPDALIAERLSGISPFTATDLSLEGEELPPFEPAAPEPPSRSAAASPPQPVAAPSRAPDPQRPAWPMQPAHFEPSTSAIDLAGILRDIEKAQKPRVRSESEVDLSFMPDDIRDPSTAAAPAGSPDLDGIFAQLRGEASRRGGHDAADEQYRRALALHDAGQIDECIEALQTAARAPRLRFVTASLLGRIYRKRRMMPQAIEWFERAAEAPAPSAEEGHLMLYELADTLESAGEVARALAICMELQADAGDFRDVSLRIDRLAKAQTRG